MLAHLKKFWPQYLGGIIVLGIILFEARSVGDFNIFISASKDLINGENIYLNKYNICYHYYYDVVFALLLAPLTYIPLYAAQVIWLILNVFFVVRIWSIIKNWVPLSELPKKHRYWFVALSFIFIASFIRDNFHLAQLTIFILYLCLEGLNLIEKKRIIAGALLIALGINIKLLPLFFIPYLFYRKEFKSGFLVMFFIVLLLFVPALILGLDYNQFLLAERWKIINPLNQEHLLDTAERSFHSITTLLSTLFVKESGDPNAMTLRRHIADISLDNLKLIILCARLALLGLCLWFLRTLPFRKADSKIQKLYEIGYICIMIPLIFPHQQFYAFLFIFPATTYLIFFVIHNYFNAQHTVSEKRKKLRKYLLLFLLGLIYFLTNSHFIFGAYNHYYDHYKTLTYGVLILIPVLAACSPARLTRKL